MCRQSENVLNHPQLKRFCVHARTFISLLHFTSVWLLTTGCSLVIRLCNYKSSTRLHRLFTHSFVHMGFLFCSCAKGVIQVHDVWGISMFSRVWPFVYIVSFLRLDYVKKKYIRSIRSFHEIPVFQCDDIFEKLHNPFGIVLRRKLGSSTSFIMKVRLMKFSGILNVNSRSPELSFESLAFKFRLDEQTNAFQN